MLNELFKKWADVFLRPNSLFKRENKAKSLSYGAKSVLLAGIISAIIIILLGVISPASVSEFQTLFGANATAALFVVSIVLVPLLSIVMWVVISGVLYLFALLLHGKGTFVSQSHALALVSSAFGIVSTLLSGLISVVVLSAPGAGIIAQIVVSAILTLYNLYVITVALKNVHKYSTGRAVLTWLIPIVIALAALLLLGIAVLSTVATAISPASV